MRKRRSLTGREGSACAASHICSHVARVEQQHRRAAVGPKITVQRFRDDVDRRLGCTGEGSGGIAGRSEGDRWEMAGAHARYAYAPPDPLSSTEPT